MWKQMQPVAEATQVKCGLYLVAEVLLLHSLKIRMLLQILSSLLERKQAKEVMQFCLVFIFKS